jgi:hypothetical protein
VAWQEDVSSTASEIWALRWNDTAWVPVGAGSAGGDGLSASLLQAREPSLVLASTGYPVVAWSDSGPDNFEIYLRRWNGQSWAELGTGGGSSAAAGGVSANAGASTSPATALDLAGNPVIAWEDTSSGNPDIYLKRWTGEAWVEVGGSATAGGISVNVVNSTDPAVALDRAANPIVAWVDYSGTAAVIFVKKWNGSAWIELAGSATGDGTIAGLFLAATPAVASDPDGNPVVAWRGSSTAFSLSSAIYLKQWNGSAWVALGGSGS